MAVSNYIKGCNYSVNKLDKVVYLFSESIVKDIRVDNGAAYVTLSSNPIGYAVSSISVEDSSSLDERYAFSHRVQFSVNGYANENFIHDKYYVAIKTVGGAYYILNPRIPCRVQYTFTLGKDECHTDFTMDTVSNDATLPLSGLSLPTPKECGYFIDGLKTLKLNESRYTKRDGNSICYTNGGFKDIDVGDDAVFTETFDGEMLSHNISFTVSMTTYKQSWYYNLLEFQNNKYVALMESKYGKVYGSGFMYGLQPSYNMNGNSSDSAYINVNLDAAYDSDIARFAYESMNDISVGECEGYTWEFTDEYGGYECVGYGVAKYLLKKRFDELDNPTTEYLVLEGYEDRFRALNVVGVFVHTETYNKDECKYPAESGGTLPSFITFGGYNCSAFTFSANCDWDASSDYSGITFTPPSGSANVLYNIEICNNNTWTGGTIYRWYQTNEIICDWFDSYFKEIYQYSEDGGNIWINTGDFRKGIVAQRESTDCGYGNKLITISSGGSEIRYSCDNNLVLTSDYPNGYDTYVGNCVRTISSGTLANTSYYHIPDNVLMIGDNALPIGINSDLQLHTIEIPSSVTIIGDSAFRIDSSVGTDVSEDAACRSMEDIIIGDGVRIINCGAFSSNSNAICGGHRVIPDPSVVTPQYEEFFFMYDPSCRIIHNIEIGASVKKICNFAFSNLNPYSITFKSDVPPILERYAFYGTAALVFVPSGSVSTYKASPYFESFKDMIFAIGTNPLSDSNVKQITTYARGENKYIDIKEWNGNEVLELYAPTQANLSIRYFTNVNTMSDWTTGWDTINLPLSTNRIYYSIYASSRVTKMPYYHKTSSTGTGSGEYNYYRAPSIIFTNNN